MVLASGEFVQASATHNADLFWAVRGGGGNFGVVTSFEYRLHPLGPQVLAGLVVYPLEQAKSVFDGYRKFTAAASDDMTVWMVLRKAPPLPFLPAEVHGKEVVVVAFCWIGDPGKGAELVKPLSGFGKPYGEMIAPMPFAGWQTAFDPLLAPGARNYWKSHDFHAMSVDVERILCDAVGRLPSDECEAFIGQLGGQTNRVAAGDTAYPHRDAEFVVNVHTRWRDACRRPQVHRLGARPVRRAGAPRHRRRVRELHARGRGAARGHRCLRAQPRAAGRAEGEVRPGQPVQPEPEHPAASLRRCGGTTEANPPRSVSCALRTTVHQTQEEMQ